MIDIATRRTFFRGVVAPVLLAAAACSPPLELPAWTLQVPEGTRVVEYPGVPLKGRDEKIEMVEELVIGGSGAAPEALLYPRSYTEGALALDPQGRLFVLDTGNFRVAAFDAASGAYLFALGGEGQGPGEFERPTRLAIAGEDLVVFDTGKLSYWSTSGEHIRDVPVPSIRLTQYLGGFSDSSLVVRVAERVDDERMLALARIDGEGAELGRYSISPGPRMEPQVISGRNLVVSHPGPEATFAVGSDDRLYWTRADEYQIAATRRDGAFDWALRVGLPAQPFPQWRIDGTLESIRQRFPEVTESSFHWPERYPALARLLVDGHGHLYVFPYVDDRYLENHDGRPVDVYSAAGDRLFCGMIGSTWEAAGGDLVYVYEDGEETGEPVVVSYRIVEPFE